MTANAKLSARAGVIEKIDAHLRQLSPHMMQRAGVVLLKDAREEICRLRAAIHQTLDENGHLADGDACTLATLKMALKAPNVQRGQADFDKSAMSEVISDGNRG